MTQFPSLDGNQRRVAPTTPTTVPLSTIRMEGLFDYECLLLHTVLYITHKTMASWHVSKPETTIVGPSFVLYKWLVKKVPTPLFYTVPCSVDKPIATIKTAPTHNKPLLELNVTGGASTAVL